MRRIDPITLDEALDLELDWWEEDGLNVRNNSENGDEFLLAWLTVIARKFDLSFEFEWWERPDLYAAMHVGGRYTITKDGVRLWTEFNLPTLRTSVAKPASNLITKSTSVLNALRLRQTDQDKVTVLSAESGRVEYREIDCAERATPR